MLSLRLSSLTKFVNYNDKIIDIGCDHALLDIFLVKNDLVKSIIASDINVQALNSGIKNIENEGLSDKISARLGDGLNVLTDKDNIDTVIISGMGTNTIMGILNNDHLKDINKLIIQSNNDHTMLRKYVTKLGFFIKNEEYFQDNKKNYINIVFVRGNKKYSKIDLTYGPILKHNKPYLEFEINNIEKIEELVPKNKILLHFQLKKEKRVLKKLLRK
ncbi:sAM-dependent methyltransferase [Firmicutes bacterium CAG:582]|nr:sAM-dependent methyltransferase [Firmicutes bacterium CAG:582]